MKKLLIVEVISRGAAFHPRYDIFSSHGYALYYLTSSPSLAPYPFAGVRTADSRDIEQLLALAREWHQQERFDAIITNDETSVIATALIGEQLGLRGLSPEAARQSRNKLLMREAHRRHGAPHPPFAPCDTVEQALAFAQEIGYPVVIKPTLGGDSEHVYRVADAEQMRLRFGLAKAGNDKHSHRYFEAEGTDMGPHGMLVEAYLDGSEHCVEAVVRDGEVSLGSVADRLSIEMDTFDHDLYKTPSSLPAASIAALKEAIRLGARAQGIENAVLHAELRFHQGRPHIVEIAARPGGGSLQFMAKLSYGYCPITTALHIAQGSAPEAPALEPTGKVAVGLTMLCEGGTLAGIHIPDNLLDNPNIFNFRVLSLLGQTIVRPPHGNDIFGYIGTTGDSLEDALATADHTFSQIKIALVPA
ncbi:MAG: ATP-grasp domain-containing protein [Pseudomonadota bacterium]